MFGAFEQLLEQYGEIGGCCALMPLGIAGFRMRSGRDAAEAASRQPIEPPESRDSAARAATVANSRENLAATARRIG